MSRIGRVGKGCATAVGSGANINAMPAKNAKNAHALVPNTKSLLLLPLGYSSNRKDSTSCQWQETAERGIATEREYDWNCAGRSFDRRNGIAASSRCDHSSLRPTRSAAR